jgi:aryl-alcohol dehydrogenase (NADP+)
MQTRKLGRSGLTVSRLCLGTMMFGGQTDEKTSRRIIDMSRDAGINFLDTADAYNGGKSERVVGRAIKANREHWVLATKVAQPRHANNPNMRGLSRRWISEGLDASLKRLGLDHVDILYFHRDDRSVATEEAIDAVATAIRAGKLRAFGLSNFRAWRHADVVRLCDAMGAPRPVVSQPYYNALNRMPEVEVLEVCANYDMGVVPYSPVARGVLTGKYAAGAAPRKGTRAGRADARMMQTEFRAESLAIAEQVVTHAKTRGMSPVHYAINWVLANPLVTATIVGPRTLSHMKDYLGSTEHAWTAEDEALIAELVPAGHPSTPGYTDPEYPLMGRPVEAG